MDEGILNDLLECSVCLERLGTSSKVLPCQHTFCRPCLEGIYKKHKELRCPECRVLVPVKIEDLPPNILLMRILEGIKSTAPKKDFKTIKHSLNTSSINNVNTHQMEQFDFSTKTESALDNSLINVQCYCQAKVLYDYISKDPESLILKKNDIVSVKKQVDKNWFYGECNGKEGVLPVSFVQMIAPLPSSIPQCRALYDFHMENDEEGCLSFNKGEVIVVIRRIDENWAEGRLQDKIGIFPLAFVELNSLAKSLIKLSTKLPDSLTPTHKTKNQLDIVTMPSSQSNYKSENTEKEEITVSELSLRLQKQPLSEKENVPGIKWKKMSMNIPAPYISLFFYKPQKIDELELRKGEIYIVTEKCQDGWFKGISKSSQKSGVFPGNYVVPIESFTRNSLEIKTGSNTSPNKTRKYSTFEQNVNEITPELPPRCFTSAVIAKSFMNSQGVEENMINVISPMIKTPIASITINQTQYDGKPVSKEPSNLMRRLTIGKKSKLPIVQHFSMDNPVFEDNMAIATSSLSAVHVRSCSCPSQMSQTSLGNHCQHIKQKIDQNATSLNSNSTRFDDKDNRRKSIQKNHQHRKSNSLDIEKGSKSSPATVSLRHQTNGELYRCIAPYPPNTEYELELQINDIIYVVKKREDGWYKGTLQRTGRTGLFPATFVEKI